MMQLKKRLSLFLAVLMVVSSMSVVSFAEENTDSDVIAYNLGSQEIIVGYDAEQAKATPWNYKLFDENGNYTIELEDNAFFPYEVQFTTSITSGNTLQVKCFETPDSTVEIDGHVFRVFSSTTDENTLSQIGFTIGDMYIPAVTEPKTFTQNAGVSPFSLLPLTTIRVSADLRGYLPAELKSVELSAILAVLSPKQSNGQSDKVVWVKKSYSSESTDEFKIAGQNELIDLTPKYSGYTDVYLELIVGSALQLDPNNKRYIVTINITSVQDALQFELYAKDGTNRENANARYNYYGTTNVYNSTTQTYEEAPQYQISVASKYTYNTEFYLGISINVAYSGLDVEVYKGKYDTAQAAASGENVTATICNQTMAEENAGLLGNYANYQQRQFFTLVYSRNGSVTAIEYFILYVYPRHNSINPQWMYKDANGKRTEAATSYSQSSTNEIITYTYTFYNNYPADAEYYFSMDYYHENTGGPDIVDTYVDKAVVGHYDTLQAAINAVDINSSLLDYDNSYGHGYLANYSGNGQNFTVFAEGEVYKFTIKAIDGTQKEPTYSDIPSLSADTYFRVTGTISGSSILPTYTVSHEHDTYYSKGYQTLLINAADVDLSMLKPMFWIADPPKAYAGLNGAEEQISGTSIQNFSNGSVLYTAKAENGSSVKNYQVSFIKKVDNAASLFVNGPDNREVFLNNAYENRHDIFIANVGTESLTGLSVTLNATNVKLDEYWTVGGTGNDTLAPFTSTGIYNYETYKYELGNIAKIRLLPAEKGDANYTKDGKIEGTLTITSANGGSRTITLTGTAGNPKIITESLKDGVKYVPYSRMVQTNNMHDWNKVTFSEMPGSKLPSGLRLLPNGEIYGVPKETGVFTVIVRADYSYSGFEDSIATFTLTIKENTNVNVDAEVDVGYSIEVRIPETVTSYSDREFKIEGVLTEFKYLYLDGDMLIKDTDYTAEDGSTKITIKSQTFRKSGDGTHTIAAEFRVDGDANKELKRAAQNFKIDINTSSGNSGNSYTPTPTPRPTLTPKPTQAPKIEAKTEEGNSNSFIITPVINGIAESDITKEGNAIFKIDVPLDSVNEMLSNEDDETLISVIIPEKEMLVAIKNLPDDVKNIELAIAISEAKGERSIIVKDVIISNKIYQQAALSEKGIIITIINGNEKEYSWIFDAEIVKNSDRKIDNHNAVINFHMINSLKNSQLKEFLNKYTGNIVGGYLLSFEHEGVLPATAKVKVYVSSNPAVTGIRPETKVYLYHINEETGSIEKIPTTEYTVDKEGYVYIDITHCSDYLILPYEVDAIGLLQQIKIPQEMTLYIPYIKGTEKSVISETNIDILLPSTMKSVNEFTDNIDKGIAEVKFSFEKGRFKAYDDVAGHKYEEALLYAIKNGLMSNSKNEIFPNSKLTKGAVCLSLNNLLGITETYQDMDSVRNLKSGDQYYVTVSRGLQYGYLKIKPNGDVYNPLVKATYGYVAEIYSSALGTDMKNIIIGENDPKDTLTRAEYAEILHKIAPSILVNDKKALISEDGKVTAQEEGNTYITVIAELSDGSKIYYSVKVVVKKPSITFNKPVTDIALGYKQEYAIKVEGYKPSDITWITLKKGRAVVSDNKGKIKAMVNGKTEGKDNLVICVDGIKIKDIEVVVK